MIDMPIILAINAGSSSLKFQLLDMPSEKVTAKGQIERIGLADSIFTIKSKHGKTEKKRDIKDHAEAANLLLDMLIREGAVSSYDEIDGVGHRVVHGGEVFSDSVLIEDETLQQLEKLSGLAPLHNPANIIGIKEFNKALPNAPAVAIFDTAFHQTMP